MDTFHRFQFSSPVLLTLEKFASLWNENKAPGWLALLGIIWNVQAKPTCEFSEVSDYTLQSLLSFCSDWNLYKIVKFHLARTKADGMFKS